MFKDEKVYEGVEMVEGCDAELGQVWLKLYHDLVSVPVIINLAAEFLAEYAPELISFYRDGMGDKLEERSLIGKLDNTKLRLLQKNITNMPAIIAVHLWRLNSCRIFFTPLNTDNFALHNCSVRDCVAGAFAEFPALGLYNIVSPVVPEMVDFVFYGNAEIMRQVIFQLLSNSLAKIQNQNQEQLPVDYLQVSTGSDDLGNYLYFRDNGGGISAEDLPHIFEKYYTTKPSKAGLGLYFCKKAMQYFGGDISCNSSIGSGSVGEGYTELVLRFRSL